MDGNTTKRRKFLMPKWTRGQLITGDPETNLRMTRLLFRPREATVKRSDSEQVTLKETLTTIHLLSIFCCSGPDPVPSDTVSKVRLRQDGSFSQSHQRLRVSTTKVRTGPSWTNYKWFWWIKLVYADRQTKCAPASARAPDGGERCVWDLCKRPK